MCEIRPDQCSDRALLSEQMAPHAVCVCSLPILNIMSLDHNQVTCNSFGHIMAALILPDYTASFRTSVVKTQAEPLAVTTVTLPKPSYSSTGGLLRTQRTKEDRLDLQVPDKPVPVAKDHNYPSSPIKRPHPDRGNRLSRNFER